MWFSVSLAVHGMFYKCFPGFIFALFGVPEVGILRTMQFFRYTVNAWSCLILVLHMPCTWYGMLGSHREVTNLYKRRPGENPLLAVSAYRQCFCACQQLIITNHVSYSLHVNRRCRRRPHYFTANFFTSILKPRVGGSVSR
jgi:hypothetical protein